MFKATKIFLGLKEKIESIGPRTVMLSGGRILIVLLSVGVLAFLYSFAIRTLNQALFTEINPSSAQTELFHLSKLKTVASYWGIETEPSLMEKDGEIED